MAQNKPINIFIADDDEDDIMLFKDAIKKANVDSIITTFKNGKELYNHVRNNTLMPDIIFLDINMPIMNGIECLKAIRETQYFHNVPVIMYSTSYHPDHINEAFNCFANLYVAKPNTLPEQVSMLKTIFQLLLNGHLEKIGRTNFEYKSKDSNLL